MKKMKKLIATLVGGLMMAMPILATPLFSQAKTVKGDFGNWTYYDYATDSTSDSGIPVSVTVNTSDEDFDFWHYSEFVYYDEDVWAAAYPDADPEELAYYKGHWSCEFYLAAYDYFEVGDTVVVQLPFSGSLTEYDLDYSDYWNVTFSSNSITFTCVKSYDEIDMEWVMYSKGSTEEDQFWFIPMKTQLNIAAEIASTSGKEAIAEVSGNFALSYEIMKWLENHPNVTLKYNLTYKEKDYNIVIQGGHKLANLEIPWYGPEYLIGKFSK